MSLKVLFKYLSVFFNTMLFSVGSCNDCVRWLQCCSDVFQLTLPSRSINIGLWHELQRTSMIQQIYLDWDSGHNIREGPSSRQPGTYLPSDTSMMADMKWEWEMSARQHPRYTLSMLFEHPSLNEVSVEQFFINVAHICPIFWTYIFQEFFKARCTLFAFYFAIYQFIHSHKAQNLFM